MEDMMQESQLIAVWRLFKRVQKEKGISCPELQLCDDESGGVVNIRGRDIIEWKTLEEGITGLEEYLSAE